MATPAQACGVQGFARDDVNFMQEDYSPIFVTFADGMETMTVQPSIEGTAKDFGLVTALPGRPTVREARRELFTQLREVMVQPSYSDRGGVKSLALDMTHGGVAPIVEVLEEKTVGSFDIAVLHADDVSALTTWLDLHHYKYAAADVTNFAYYVQRGDSSFVAMKVSSAGQDIKSEGGVGGKLTPIEFAFPTPRPILPMHIVAGDKDTMHFTLYALAANPIFIPGASLKDVRKLGLLDLTSAPVLIQYAAAGQYLSRSDVTYDPRRITEDLQLSQTDYPAIRQFGWPITLNAASASPGSGIVADLHSAETIAVFGADVPNPAGFPLLWVLRLMLIAVVAFAAYNFFRRILVPARVHAEQRGAHLFSPATAAVVIFGLIYLLVDHRSFLHFPVSLLISFVLGCAALIFFSFLRPTPADTLPTRIRRTLAGLAALIVMVEIPATLIIIRTALEGNGARTHLSYGYFPGYESAPGKIVVNIVCLAIVIATLFLIRSALRLGRADQNRQAVLSILLVLIAMLLVTVLMLGMMMPLIGEGEGSLLQRMSFGLLFDGAVAIMIGAGIEMILERRSLIQQGMLPAKGLLAWTCRLLAAVVLLVLLKTFFPLWVFVRYLF